MKKYFVKNQIAVSVMGIIWSLFWLAFLAWVCLNMGLYKEMKILLFPFASLVVSVIGFAFSKRRGVKRIRLFVFQAVLLFLSVDLFQGISTEKMYRYAFQLPIMILSLELIAFTELYQSMAKSRIKRINGNKSKSSN